MNSQYFSAEQIKHGELQKLLDFLTSEAYGAGDHYNDIHIYPSDLGAFIVEWVQLPWSHDYGGRFEYVDDDQVVFREYRLPDNSYITCRTDEEFDEYLNEWLIQNPGWEKTSYGTWTNQLENEAFRQEFIDDKEEETSFDNPLSGLEENGMPQ